MPLEIGRVHVRLVEAIEKHQTRRTGELERDRQLPERGIVGREFHGDGDAHRARDLPDRPQQFGLHLVGADIDVGHHPVEIKFDRVRARLLEPGGEIRPRARVMAAQKGEAPTTKGLRSGRPRQEVARFMGNRDGRQHTPRRGPAAPRRLRFAAHGLPAV